MWFCTNAATLCRQPISSLCLSPFPPLSLSLCHTLMSEPLDVDSRLIQALNEWCFINGPIIRLPAGGQSPSIFSARRSNNEGRITHLEERRRLSGLCSMLISYNSYACTYSRLDAGDKQVMHVWNNYEQDCCCYWMINRWTSKAVGLLSIHPTLHSQGKNVVKSIFDPATRSCSSSWPPQSFA